MHAFDVLGDPVRRRLLELIADAGEPVQAGELAARLHDEVGISHPAVSQHLRVLREAGFATATPSGTRRLYAVGDQPWAQIDAWLARYRPFWDHHLDALATEVARGRRRTPTPDPQETS